MMRIENGHFHSSERISSGTGHVSVEELGLAPVLIAGSGKSDPDKTSVSIVLPTLLPGPAKVLLAEGRETHVMLAWSQDRDFAHHSAWRRHFQKTL